jgi:hypothetical protein
MLTEQPRICHRACAAPNGMRAGPLAVILAPHAGVTGVQRPVRGGGAGPARGCGARSPAQPFAGHGLWGHAPSACAACAPPSVPRPVPRPLSPWLDPLGSLGPVLGSLYTFLCSFLGPLPLYNAGCFCYDQRQPRQGRNPVKTKSRSFQRHPCARFASMVAPTLGGRAMLERRRSCVFGHPVPTARRFAARAAPWPRQRGQLRDTRRRGA